MLWRTVISLLIVAVLVIIFMMQIFWREVFHNRGFSHRFWLQMCGFRFTPLPHMNAVSMFQLSDFTLGRMSFESLLSHRTSETWHSYENQQVSVTISTETWGLSFHTHVVTLFIFLKKAELWKGKFPKRTMMGNKSNSITTSPLSEIR